MNIMMFLVRFQILKVDIDGSGGKKFEWNEDSLSIMIRQVVPENFKTLSSNQAQATKIISKQKEEGYLSLPKS